MRLRKGEAVYTVLAKKEVILSAGTLNSAQLLMLSGELKTKLLNYNPPVFTSAHHLQVLDQQTI